MSIPRECRASAIRIGERVRAIVETARQRGELAGERLTADGWVVCSIHPTALTYETTVAAAPANRTAWFVDRGFLAPSLNTYRRVTREVRSYARADVVIGTAGGCAIVEARSREAGFDVSWKPWNQLRGPGDFRRILAPYGRVASRMPISTARRLARWLQPARLHVVVRVRFAVDTDRRVLALPDGQPLWMAWLVLAESPELVPA